MTPAEVVHLRKLATILEGFVIDCPFDANPVASVAGELRHLANRYAPPDAGLRGVVVDPESDPAESWFTVAPRAGTEPGVTGVRYDNGKAARHLDRDIHRAVAEAAALNHFAVCAAGGKIAAGTWVVVTSPLVEECAFGRATRMSGAEVIVDWHEAPYGIDIGEGVEPFALISCNTEDEARTLWVQAVSDARGEET